MTPSGAKAWRCTVCGYVHRGDEPPETCPVCGSARTDFEPYEEPAAPAVVEVRRWRCLNCSYVHEGPEPPEVCPVCGAPRDRFEPAAEEAEPAAAGAEAGRLVVLGAGIAGISAVEAARRSAPQAEILLVSKEQSLPYYRLNLTRYLAGEIESESLPIHPAGWYDRQKIDLVLGADAAALSLADGSVELRDGRRLAFDRLVLAAGAHPFMPPIPGSHRDGVTSLRTDRDAEHILSRLRPGLPCVCIGGGLLGLETAGALARRRADVTLLEGHAWLMPRQLNPRAGELLADHVRGVGIRLRTEARTKEIVGDEATAGVLLEDGRTLPAELVIVATGVRPNSHLARRAGLEVNQGVVVDNHLCSGDSNVLAAGDVAEHRGTLYGSWAASQYQGHIAGMNAVGASVEFGGIPRSHTLKVLGLDLLSIGKFEPEDGSFDVIEGERGGEYLRFVFHDGRLVGSVLLGDASAASGVKKAVESGADVSGLLAQRPAAGDVADYLKKGIEH